MISNLSVALPEKKAKVWSVTQSKTHSLGKVQWFYKGLNHLTFFEDMHVKITMPPIDADKQNFEHKTAIISLSVSLNICFGCSKEPSR